MSDTSEVAEVVRGERFMWLTATTANWAVAISSERVICVTYNKGTQAYAASRLAVPQELPRMVHRVEGSTFPPEVNLALSVALLAAQ